MRAVTIPSYGGPDVLTLADVADPAPGPDEILVRVTHSACNRADTLQRMGGYPDPVRRDVEIPGLEYAGTVVALGARVTNWELGDRVMGIESGACYAELVATHCRQALPIPAAIATEDAAGIPEVYLTAWDALVVQGGLTSGRWALVHAGASGVGTAAIQIAKAIGARIAVTCSAGKVEACRELGADLVIERSPHDWLAELQPAVPNGVDVVLDVVGGEEADRNLKAVRTQGAIVQVGLMGGGQTPVNLGLLLVKRITWIGTTLRARPIEQKIALCQRFAAEVLPLFESGALRPVIDSRERLEAVADAHRHMESNANIGKILLEIGVIVPRPPKQEQEPAGEAITEVAPGVLRAQLPIDMPGLGHVNCYVLEDERGAAIVDPGLAGSASRAALKSRLAAAGIPMRRVHTVIVTHSHPDHFGAAGWVRHETGADIVTHRRFRLMWDPSEPPDVDVEDVVTGVDVNGGDGDGCVDAGELQAELALRSKPRMPWDPAPWGGSGMTIPFRRRARLKLSVRFPRLLRLPVPSVRLDDAGTIRLAGRDWMALHTPGHTEDHLCLFDPTDGVMLSGDHVLPTITPHIGGFGPYRDPLACFFNSLDKVAVHGPDTSICLPAHGHPFTNLAVRVDAIKRHHRERLDTLRSAFEGIGRPASVNELSVHLFSARAQGAMADSETFAHLEHLRVAGEVARTDAPTGYTYLPTA